MILTLALALAAHAAAPLYEVSDGEAQAWSAVAPVVGYAALFGATQAREDGLAGGLLVAGLAGAVVGPSAGHLRAGNWQHAAAFTGLRAASLGGLVVGGRHVLSQDYCLMVEGGDPNGCRDPAWAAPLFAASAVSFVGLTVYDVIDARRAPDRRARYVMARVRPDVAWRDGEVQGGLAVDGTF